MAVVEDLGEHIIRSRQRERLGVAVVDLNGSIIKSRGRE